MKRLKTILKADFIISLILLMALVSATTALLVMSSLKTNAFTAGENRSSIREVFGEYMDLKSGADCEKRVSVVNEGSTSCYVRVFAEIQDPDIRKSITVDFDRENWSEKNSDGYYYYRRVLKSGEQTEPLFTTLHAEKDLSRLDMICYSETVQAYGADTAEEAFAQLDRKEK